MAKPVARKAGPLDDRIEELPDVARKGRGAVSNQVGRYEKATVHAVDDGWGHVPDAADEDLPPRRTELIDDATRTIIARNDSPDLSFDRSINPYRGCEHGCIYCFARPSHAYLGFSPGLDFETKILRKPRAASLLVEELRAKKYVCQPMAMGTNTDPYQPVERTEKITRSVMEVLRDFNHPVGIVTKNALVTRDIDILAPMADRKLAMVGISVTTLDPDLARRMEPRASAPRKRLDAIRALSKAGIPVAVMAAPMIPGLNDHEMEAIIEAGVEAGASQASSILVRLPLEIKDLFQEWLKEHAPLRADKVISLIRQTREGGLYNDQFGRRMTGSGPYAELLAKRLKLTRERLGIAERKWDLDVGKFRVPPRAGDQLSFL
jgi:DNA repair photolyase